MIKFDKRGDIMKCPVCNKETREEICPICGYNLENDLLNNNLLNKLTKKEVETYKKQIQTHKNLYQQLQILKTNNSKLEKQLKQSHNKINNDKQLEILAKKDPRSADELATIAYDFFQKKDYVKSEYYFKAASDKGSPRAAFYLGLMKQYGELPYKGIKQDYSQALYYYQLAADRGWTLGLRSLGNMYLEGLGVEPDLKKAISFYEEAIRRKDSWGRYELATHYRLGRKYLRQDYKKAAELYQEDIDSGFGNNLSRFYLSQLYENGQGVEKDLRKANQLKQEYIRLGGKI